MHDISKSISLSIYTYAYKVDRGDQIKNKHMTPQPTDYGLRVSIGPDYSIDKMLPIHVNEESNPTLIDSPYFKGHTVVRVLEFTGISHSNHVQVRNPQSSYFTNRNRRYSIMIQG